MIPKDEYNSNFQAYIDLTASEKIVNGLKENSEEVVDFYNNLPEEILNYSYAPGKWTPKDILLHLIDAERVFCYRALRVARKDKTPMIGFEQDDYVNEAKASKRRIQSLLDEYKAVRKASIALFESFSEEQLTSIGIASNSKISVRALGYMLTGHENHHIKVIKERYFDYKN